MPIIFEGVALRENPESKEICVCSSLPAPERL